MSQRKEKKQRELEQFKELLEESKGKEIVEEAQADDSPEELLAEDDSQPIQAAQYKCPKCGEALASRKSACEKCGYNGYVPMGEADIRRVRGVLFFIAVLALLIVLLVKNA